MAAIVVQQQRQRQQQQMEVCAQNSPGCSDGEQCGDTGENLHLIKRKRSVAKGLGVDQPVCPIVTEDSANNNKSLYTDLDEYVYDAQCRRSLEPEPQDVYAELRQRERDLRLAAELGKALLEKNDELSKRNERLAEEFSEKLEEIEQDRHSLKRRLVNAQTESDAKLLELQADVRDLQAAVSQRERQLRQTEKEKARLVSELTEQNHRLQTQIKELSKTEHDLQAQCRQLQDQCSQRKWSLHDHQSSLDVLREEIQFTAEKKQELERRVHAIQADRDQIAVALEEALDRVRSVERECREYEIKHHSLRKQLDELHRANCVLSSKLHDAKKCQNGGDSLVGPLSLQMEMDQAEGRVTAAPVISSEQSPSHEESVTGQLLRLCGQLEITGENADNDEQRQSLKEAVRRLNKALGVGGYNVSNQSTEEETAVDLNRTREEADRLRDKLNLVQTELRGRNEHINQLTSELSVRDTELQTAREERDFALKDKQAVLENNKVEDIVKAAWEARDGAVARKNAAQVQLARTRIDVLQANGQLMEAIRQKVELSQQLEQWQMDMQALLDDQMRRKLLGIQHSNCPNGGSGQSMGSQQQDYCMSYSSIDFLGNGDHDGNGAENKRTSSTSLRSLSSFAGWGSGGDGNSSGRRLFAGLFQPSSSTNSTR
ncbi:bicaudal D-related protein homolog [Daktulosphaira vitifoliae]|uniref:bicaudal D-related protein homolog n=1 Tax=Daktulosphaira vitifoliae TaxID=58002 RepID=UPI0021AA1CFC|nr:bicaudal D-related protein homolog [Daktulosphaira vitifoliae]